MTLFKTNKLKLFSENHFKRIQFFFFSGDFLDFFGADRSSVGRSKRHQVFVLRMTSQKMILDDVEAFQFCDQPSQPNLASMMTRLTCAERLIE